MNNTMDNWIEFQKETMGKFFQMSTSAGEQFKSFNPLEVINQFKGFEGSSENAKKITENNLKYYGNECNVMAEILLSRYDIFISKNILTHITSNLSASEIESAYGNRIRSRLRNMLNLIAFDKTTKDKR